MGFHCIVNQEFHLSGVSMCALECVSVPYKSVWWIVVFAQIATTLFPILDGNLAEACQLLIQNGIYVSSPPTGPAPV